MSEAKIELAKLAVQAMREACATPQRDPNICAAIIAKAFENASQWISVKERLPDNQRDVLVIDECDVQWIARCFYQGTPEQCWCWGDQDFALHGVTHWQELLPPPSRS